MNKFLGIVEGGRFIILSPQEDFCCSIRLTKVLEPSPLSEQAVTSHEIDLSEHEGKALMVSGHLPEEKSWIYGAEIIDQAGPIMAAMVQQMFGQYVEYEPMAGYDVFEVAKEIDDRLVQMSTALEEKGKFSEVRDMLKSRIELLKVVALFDINDND
jgi:hypothetical protein